MYLEVQRSSCGAGQPFRSERGNCARAAVLCRWVMGRSQGSRFAAGLVLALLAPGGGDPSPRGHDPVTVATTFSPERALASGSRQEVE